MRPGHSSCCQELSTPIIWWSNTKAHHKVSGPHMFHKPTLSCPLEIHIESSHSSVPHHRLWFRPKALLLIWRNRNRLCPHLTPTQFLSSASLMHPGKLTPRHHGESSFIQAFLAWLDIVGSRWSADNWASWLPSYSNTCRFNWPGIHIVQNSHSSICSCVFLSSWMVYFILSYPLEIHVESSHSPVLCDK